MIPPTDKSIPDLDNFLNALYLATPLLNVTLFPSLHSVTFYLAPGIGYTSSTTSLERRISMVIRQRNSRLDDDAIMSLIDSQLVPLSHMSTNEINKIRKDIPLRMNRA